MKIQRQQRIIKTSARLLIVASLACVFFGNGVHVHSLIDHIFDHGDVHIVIHAHDHSTNSDKEDHHTSNPEKDNHQVAKVDLNGILLQSRVLVDHPKIITNVVANVSDWDFEATTDHNFELDLPPPEISYLGFSPSSFSLRAPPFA